MKKTLLSLLVLLAAPAWADLVPIVSDSRVDEAIAVYQDPESPVTRLMRNVRALEYCAESGNQKAQAFIAQEFLVKDPALDEKNGLIQKLKKRCEQKDPEACHHLFGIYYSGTYGKKDQHVGLDYLEKAADLGHMKANKALGELYLNGNGVEKDFVKARHYLQRASDLGLSSASILLKELNQAEKTAEDKEKADPAKPLAPDSGN